MKKAKPNLHEVNLHHKTTTKILYQQRPSEAWIPSYGPLKIKEDQSVHPEFPLQETDFWDPTFFHHV
jgi:hypothetical protein